MKENGIMSFKNEQYLATSEMWKKIDGYLYEVSNLGRVRRSEKGSAKNTHAGKMLKLRTDKYGYTVARLCSGGIVRDVKVHRLVCTAFNGAPSAPTLETRHKNGIRSDNTPNNLEWGTTQDNADDRARHGNTGRGEKSGRALLTNDRVLALRLQHAQARIGRKRVVRGTLSRLSQEFGISISSVAGISGGRGYAHQ